MKKRIEWIDICKFIAITIMVIGHIGLPTKLSDLIHIFHMPIFFLLSGLCLNFEKYSNFCFFLKSRLKTLIIPHLIWSIIMYVVWRVYICFGDMGECVSFYKFIVLLFTKDAEVVYFGQFGVIQWFFTSLFFSEIFTWLVLKVSHSALFVKKKKYWILIWGLICLGIGTALGVFVQYNPLGVYTALVGAFFCLVGYSLREKLLNAETATKIVNPYLIFVGIVLLLVSWIFNAPVNMRTQDYGNVVLFIIGAFAGCYLIYVVAKGIVVLFGENKDHIIYRYMIYLGKNTLTILIFNRFVQFTIVQLFNNVIFMLVNIEPGSNLIFEIVLRFVDLLIEMVAFIPIIYFVNYCLPWTVGKARKGGTDEKK